MTDTVCRQTIDAGGILVLAPGLLSQVSNAGASVSADKLCRMLRLADQIDLQSAEHPSVESIVASALLPEQGSTGAALITYLKDFGVPKDAHHSSPVLRTDPAYQQIDMNNATLGNPLELDLTLAECERLQQTLNEHFAEDSIRFECKDPYRWYCHFDTLPDVTTTPINAAIGRDVAECRPTGTDSRKWRRKLAEIEMLLFEHPVNIARQSENKLPVNSLWLWGEGSPVAGVNADDIALFSDNFYVQSIAEFFGVASHELPDTPATFKPNGGPALVCCDKFSNAVADNLADDSNQPLHWFEQTICDQLWRSLHTDGWPEVTLWFGDDRLFRVPASVKKQFWRRLRTRSKPLSDYLPDGASPVDNLL